MPSDEVLRTFDAMLRATEVSDSDQTFKEKYDALKARIEADPNSVRPMRLYPDLETFIRGRLTELRAMYVQATETGDRLAMYIACARYFELRLVGERIGMEIEHPDTFMRDKERVHTGTDGLLPEAQP